MSTDQHSTVFADLHLLTVLAATRSFTQAARRLGISKASVSARISELERNAGVMLVRRTTRSVGLTEAGQQLVAEIEPAFGRIAGSFTAARDTAGAPRGLVRVTAPVALGRQHLAPRVADFLKKFPDIRIELDLTDRFVNLANEGFDLAIRHTSTPPETHVAWVLCETRSLLLASRDYLARRGVPDHPSALASHDGLLYLGDQAGSWTFVRTTKKRGAAERVGVTMRATLRANNSEVLREALLAGLGIGLLPDFSLRNEAPTLPTARGSLPPQGAAGRGSKPANAGLDGTQRGGVLPPGGLQGLRLRPGKAGSAAPAGVGGVSTPVISCDFGVALREAGEQSPSLVRVLPDWQVQGFFGDRIYALRPWSPQVPKAVQCLVEHLRESFAGGFAQERT